MSDQPPFDELPDGLRELVAGIVGEPVPAELTQQVRQRLRRSPPAPMARRGQRHGTLPAVIASAAAIAFVVVVLQPARSPSPPNDLDVVNAGHADASVNRPTLRGPSLWAYHRAAADSWDAVDALLTQHAGQVLSPTASIRTFTPLSFEEDL